MVYVWLYRVRTAEEQALLLDTCDIFSLFLLPHNWKWKTQADVLGRERWRQVQVYGKLDLSK